MTDLDATDEVGREPNTRALIRALRGSRDSAQRVADLDAISVRLEAATSGALGGVGDGAWTAVKQTRADEPGVWAPTVRMGSAWTAHVPSFEVAEFIAHAREDIPTLLSAVSVLEEQNAALRAAIHDIDAHATPLAEDDDGFVAVGYAVSVGSLHRALGLIGHTAARGGSE